MAPDDLDADTARIMVSGVFAGCAIVAILVACIVVGVIVSRWLGLM